jgi:hypothetical protein
VADAPTPGVGAEGVERRLVREPQDVDLAVAVGGAEAAFEAAGVVGEQGKHRVLVLPECRKAVVRHVRDEEVGHAAGHRLILAWSPAR